MFSVTRSKLKQLHQAKFDKFWRVQIRSNKKLDKIALSRQRVGRLQRTTSVHTLVQNLPARILERRKTIDFRKVRSILKNPVDKPRDNIACRKVVTFAEPSTSSSAHNDQSSQNTNNESLANWPIDSIYSTAPNIDEPTIMSPTIEDRLNQNYTEHRPNQNNNEELLIDFSDDLVFSAGPTTSPVVDSSLIDSQNDNFLGADESVNSSSAVAESSNQNQDDGNLIDLSNDFSQPIQSSRALSVIGDLIYPTVLHANVCASAPDYKNQSERLAGLTLKNYGSITAKGNQNTSFQAVASTSSNDQMKSSVANMVRIIGMVCVS